MLNGMYLRCGEELVKHILFYWIFSQHLFDYIEMKNIFENIVIMSLILSFLSVCFCIPMCESKCVGVYTWRLEVNLGRQFIFYSLGCRDSFLLFWVLPSRVACLASKLGHLFAFLCQEIGFQICTMTFTVFIWVLGIELKPLYVCSKHGTHKVILQPQQCPSLCV